MKIKVRISILITVLSIIFFILIFTVYFKCNFIYRPISGRLILDDDTIKPVDEVSALRKEIWKDAQRQIPQRRHKVKFPNIAYGGSSRSVEVVDNDENDAFLNDVPLSTSGLGFIPASNSFLRSKLVEDCLNMERMYSSEDNRQYFSDLVQLSQEMQSSPLFDSGFQQSKITLQQLLSTKSGNNLTVMQKFQNKISIQHLYDENDPVVDAVLEEMASMKIKRVVEISKGTQLKLIVTFDDGSQALLKPMRYDRNKETNPNHYYFSDFERHNSEIASFHLDRILGFRCCPPVVGRKVHIKTELFDNAEKEFKNTFFISPADNICFYGHCKQYCDTSHAICGQPDVVEVSLAALLVPERKKWKSPWKRTYSKKNPVAEWEKNDTYCQILKKQAFYDHSKRLADLMDMFFLDFLIGNMDRHSFETFTIFGNNSLILHLDQGRGFGRANHDELSILTPLKQCCVLHPKTFYRLVDLQHVGLKLSTQMRCSLYKDPLKPVLTESHLEALDRRLEIILYAIRDCIQKEGMNNVFYR